MRISWLGTFVLLTAVLAPLRSSADTPLQENFDSYAIGADLPVGPWLWTLGNIPASGTAKIQNSLILPGTGNNALEITGGETGTGIIIKLASSALENRNAGNGIQQGTVQFDYLNKSSTSLWHQARLYDDPGTGIPAFGDLMCQIIWNSVIRLQHRNAADTAPVTTDSPPYSLNTPYRFLFTFDKSNRSLTYEVKDNGPTFDHTFVSVTGCFSSSDAGFKGLRGLFFGTGSTGSVIYQIDNIIVTDTGAPAGPEVEVKDGSTDIADGGGPIDFGSARVGGAALSKTFTVNNVGTADLATSNVTVPAGYSITEPLSGTIPASGSDTFTVQLPTTAEGTFSGVISFDNDDSDENPFNFSVTGRIQAVSRVKKWSRFE